MTIPTRKDEREARDTLEFIRDTMESATSFTAVSGWGLVAVGVVGLVAAGLSWNRGSIADLDIWVPAALVAIIASATTTASKARKLEVPLWSGSFRKMVWVMVPTLLAGAILTGALWANDAASLLPGTWLSLYGAGVAAGGTYSLRTFRWMGLIFLALGAVTLFWSGSELILMAASFGGLHVAAGIHVIRQHGG